MKNLQTLGCLHVLRFRERLKEFCKGIDINYLGKSQRSSDQHLDNMSNWSFWQRSKVTTKAKTHGDTCTLPPTSTQEGKEWIWANRVGALHMSWRNTSDPLPKKWELTEPSLPRFPACCMSSHVCLDLTLPKSPNMRLFLATSCWVYTSPYFWLRHYVLFNLNLQSPVWH